MTLDTYLAALSLRRVHLLLDAMEHNDVRAALLLLAWWDVRVCCAPGHHRKEWYYSGAALYCCSVCERIAV